MFDEASPKVVTVPTWQDVGNESSGDVHLVASETSIEPKRSSAALPLIRIASADSVGLLDTDDVVVVMSTLNQESSSGDTYPVANLATAQGIIDGIGSGEGDSNAARPIASEMSIKLKVKALIDEVVEVAEADNGALLLGASPNSTRYEATEDLMAARDLLSTLYSCMGRYGK